MLEWLFQIGVTIGVLLKISKTISIVAALASCLLGTANANNIVQNGSFTAYLSGWTESQFRVVSQYIGGGNFISSAMTGCVGSECMGLPGTPGSAYISQVLSTTLGQTYNLSFSLNNSGGPANEVSVHWGTSQVFDLKDWPITGHIDYAVTGLVATGTSTTLTFNARQDPLYMGITNISVVAAPIPEPETYAMLLAGLGLIAGVARRKQ
jgi:hypothetical protein